MRAMMELNETEQLIQKSEPFISIETHGREIDNARKFRAFRQTFYAATKPYMEQVAAGQLIDVPLGLVFNPDKEIIRFCLIKLFSLVTRLTKTNLNLSRRLKNLRCGVMC